MTNDFISANDLAQSTLDGLAAHIAILDHEGRIIGVNRAWRRFAEANLPGGISGTENVFAEGANYLTVCETATGQCSDEAGDAVRGIRSVLAGEQELFSLEYPCHAPNEPRWFCLRVTRFPGGGPARVIISPRKYHRSQDGGTKSSAACRGTCRIDPSSGTQNQELDQFAYVTSHDLKAPLRGIANLSRWIEEDIEGQISEEVRHHLDLMRGRVNRMEAMIRWHSGVFSNRTDTDYTRTCGRERITDGNH